MTDDSRAFEGLNPAALESASTRLALKRAGITIAAVAGGAYGLGAVFTYSADDPSFNTATDAAATNLFGGPGAAFADLMMQSTGWAAPLALGAVMTAGIGRVLRKRMAAPISMNRLMSGAAGVSLLAGFVASFGRPEFWPLATGLGGMLGDTVFGVLRGLLSFTGLPWADPLAGFGCAIGGLAALGWAFKVTGDDVRSAAGVASRVAVGAGGAAQAAAARLAQQRRQQEAQDPWAYPPQVEQEPAARHYPALQGEPFDPPIAPRRPPTAYDDLPIPNAPPQQQQAPQQPPPQMQPRPAQRAAARKKANQNAQQAAWVGVNFRLPGPELLAPPKPRQAHADGAALAAASKRLAAVLQDFGVQGDIVAARPGPVVTLFELEPAPGVKSSRVVGLADDIARSMSATAARVAVIPGRNAIGIELPNPKRETVYLRGLLGSNAFIGNQGGLPLALGETIEGEPFAADLTKMPHLLIAGTTGSGKSVGINAMILSLLCRLTPDQCRFIMIDPKMLELSVYEGIPHLLHPVVTDPKKAVVALKWTVREMEERYRKMAKLGVRNINGYNDRVTEALNKNEKLGRSVHTGFDPDTGEPIFETEQLPVEAMPYIVVVIDEMADLMITAGKEIEAAVQRLAQMARAAGIHVVMATQRPSVDVITGTIKANFPTRISYSVTSKIDSRTILGEQGAEQLLGMGDLLFMAGGGRIRRLHGPFVTDAEVERVVSMLKAQGAPAYRNDITEDPESANADDGEGAGLLEGMGISTGDDLFDRAVAIVQRDRKASTSYLQRRLQVGYNRAASLVERMEKEGIISAANHAGKRDILLPALNGD